MEIIHRDQPKLDQSTRSDIRDTVSRIGAIKKRIGDYSYLPTSKIGTGYSSTVYRGRHDLTNQDVAIKIIDLRNMKGEVHQQLLNNEIAILKELRNHNNIIHLHEVYRVGTTVSLVTELCGSGDLSSKIKQQKNTTTKSCFSESQAIKYIKAIIEGYRKIYKKGIVHRDLKPANILISKSGDVKIADFGFAIKKADLKANSNINVGSPMYMSYEALAYNEYSSLSDVWAIGVMFFEMLTGHAPFSGKTETDLKKCIKFAVVSKIIPEWVSSRSRQFLQKSLQFATNQRMTVQELSSYFQDSRSQLLKSTSNQFKSKIDRTCATTQDDEQELNIRSKLYNLMKITTKNSCTEIIESAKIDQRVLTQVQTSKLQKYLPKTIRKLQQIPSSKNRTSDIGTKTSLRTTSESAIYRISPLLVNNMYLASINQINLCLFIHKILKMRIKIQMGDLTVEGVSKRFSRQFQGFINKKMIEIEMLESIEDEAKAQFKKRSEYPQLIQQINEAAQIMGTQGTQGVKIKEINYQKYAQILQQEIQSLIPYFKRLLTSSFLSPSEGISQLNKHFIIFFDYLITLKQMIAILNSSDDYINFKSSVQVKEILDGKPSNNITWKHLQKIMTKLKTLKLLKDTRAQ